VIDKSFKTFSKNDFDFSINITDQDLSENYLVDYLWAKAKEYNIKPNRVFLEVLENINYQDSHDSSLQFEKLRELGFRLAIDDFGAEASNLSRLLTLKADIIKIDGQFVKNLDSDKDSILIVETVVSLAKKMGVKTVAEFVHNEEIYAVVQELGVDFSQGFYFSPPLPQVAQSKKSLEKLSA
jgi:EAL domain-containing protein (putative c-di-GMP-specific phosphodiesterase class I)